MRLGNDLIILTKKNSMLTILLISNSFLRNENVKDEVQHQLKKNLIENSNNFFCFTLR